MKKLFKIFESKTVYGDQLTQRLLDVVKKDKILMTHDSGYRIEIDNRIYTFVKYDWYDQRLSVYDINQKVDIKGFSVIFSGIPISYYPISNKTWKTVETFYLSNNSSNDLKHIEEVNKI